MAKVRHSEFLTKLYFDNGIAYDRWCDKPFFYWNGTPIEIEWDIDQAEDSDEIVVSVYHVYYTTEGTKATNSAKRATLAPLKIAKHKEMLADLQKQLDEVLATRKPNGKFSDKNRKLRNRLTAQISEEKRLIATFEADLEAA